MTLLGVMAAAGIPPARADEPVLHHVTYTVTAERPTHAGIYFRDTDPPNWAEYSHNPYQFSPKAEADIGPGARWTRDVMLTAPDQWATVTATSGPAPGTPQFHCELAVDGAIVATNSGPKGALCALRHW
ncbi:hypothetical protein A5706_05325 [Mycobacterium sp. E796]|nr:hypothetical protein [Mycobacterium sp. E796]OBI43412.1 hypothetical protein A5706_05325 [Mycobacterium sp. E796]